GGRAHHRGDEPRSPPDGGTAALPGRPLLSAECVFDPPFGAPRATRGSSRTRALLRAAARAPDEPPHRGDPGRDARGAAALCVARECARAREPDRARGVPLAWPDARGPPRRPRAPASRYRRDG